MRGLVGLLSELRDELGFFACPREEREGMRQRESQDSSTSSYASICRGEGEIEKQDKQNNPSPEREREELPRATETGHTDQYWR